MVITEWTLLLFHVHVLCTREQHTVRLYMSLLIGSFAFGSAYARWPGDMHTSSQGSIAAMELRGGEMFVYRLRRLLPREGERIKSNIRELPEALELGVAERLHFFSCCAGWGGMEASSSTGTIILECWSGLHQDRWFPVLAKEWDMAYTRSSKLLQPITTSWR